MIPLNKYKGKVAAVLGLGKSGLAAARALDQAGARVLAWDDAQKARDAAQNADIKIADLAQADWSAIDVLILSPGIAFTHPAPHPVVRQAQESNRPVIGDVELFAQAIEDLPRARVVGVTGTNGKSTTTALIAHILKEAGTDAVMGGNIGRPVLELDPVSQGGVYVLELSSYQLDLSPSLHADVAILLNISPDHIDRHGSLEGYVAAKKKLIDQQQPDAVTILGIDDRYCRDIYDTVKAAGEREVVPVSVEGASGGVAVKDGILTEDGAEIGDLREMERLPGVHNWQNAAAAYAACRALGLTAARIMAGMKSFAGLPHRMELVATFKGVSFVNDSKATNAVAAKRAIDCYDNIYWIAGGRAKEGGIEEIRPSFGRIRHAYLIGEAAPDFSETLDGDVAHTQCGVLDHAVERAAEDAFESRDEARVVLFSPACASFDQFVDFEARGDAFRNAVERLANGRAA